MADQSSVPRRRHASIWREPERHLEIWAATSAVMFTGLSVLIALGAARDLPVLGGFAFTMISTGVFQSHGLRLRRRQAAAWMAAHPAQYLTGQHDRSEP